MKDTNIYLGSIFSRGGRHIDCWIAGNRFNRAFSRIDETNVSTAALLAVHNTLLAPTLLYGSDPWVLQKKNERKMNAMEMLSYCRIFSLADRFAIKRYTE